MVCEQGKRLVLEVGNGSRPCDWIFNFLDLLKLNRGCPASEVPFASNLSKAGLFSCGVLLICGLVGLPIREKARPPKDFYAKLIKGRALAVFAPGNWIQQLLEPKENTALSCNRIGCLWVDGLLCLYFIPSMGSGNQVGKQHVQAAYEIKSLQFSECQSNS